MMNNESLSNIYKNYFPIGTILNEQLLEIDKNLILRHFNSITPENALKHEIVHPDEHTYNFECADKLISFAITNNMYVRGHVLVWHEQTPECFFYDEKGYQLTANAMLTRLREYINIVVRHFGDKIYCWDVVNEAISDENQFYRQSKYFSIIGEEYIEKSFLYAHEANSKIELYYNDYNIESGEKGEKAYKLVKKLVEKEIPIHGIGIQAHYDIYRHNPDDLKNVIEKYAKLGLKVQITEMDVSVFDFFDKERNHLKPTAEMLKKQELFYRRAFEIFREYSDVIQGVTIWGVSDRYTWKDEFPIKGKKDWPLLFDEYGQTKSAFHSIISF